MIFAGRFRHSYTTVTNYLSIHMLQHLRSKMSSLWRCRGFIQRMGWMNGDTVGKPGDGQNQWRLRAFSIGECIGNGVNGSIMEIPSTNILLPCYFSLFMSPRFPSILRRFLE